MFLSTASYKQFFPPRQQQQFVFVSYSIFEIDNHNKIKMGKVLVFKPLTEKDYTTGRAVMVYQM